MAEEGSFADRVKQQADIVRVIGEYVRLKKNGQNFTGLCPFHGEKTPSFAVHPLKQIYHCFGCGVGGDVFKFVIEMEKCDFMDAVRLVAEKCGIPIPQARGRSPEERRETQQRAATIEMHREAAAFFVRQLEGGVEGKAARAYLTDRGLTPAAITQFGLGYAPSGGDLLTRHFKSKYADKLLETSGLTGRDASGRLYDRFRRRIMFPIASESGKVIAFGGRALGDDLPKYLNSPETAIYSKSGVLYNLGRAKDPIRQSDSVVLVEGYMDAITVAGAGVGNVVASCGTSLTETQVKLLSRFTKRIIVNYDSDTAGQTATQRSLSLLLEQNCEIRVLALPDGKDPDGFVRTEGAEAYRKLLAAAPSYLDYLIGRARQPGIATAEEKLHAVNSLLPFVQRIPNGLLRSEWATRISQELRVDEPAFREALRHAAAERRGELKPKFAPVARLAKPAERRLLQMLLEESDFRERLAAEIRDAELHRGLETENIFVALLKHSMGGARPDMNALAPELDERERGILFEAGFQAGAEPLWEEAESCLEVLRRRKAELELQIVQRQIDSQSGSKLGSSDELNQLLTKKLELRRQLSRLVH